MNENYKKYIAEAIGTFTLVFVGAGAICTDYYLKSAGGAGIGLVGVSIAFGLAAMASIYGLGYISGSHINPAITIACWATRRMDTNLTVFYVLSQLLGATIAGFVLKTIYPQAITSVHLGSTFLGQGVPMARGVLMEFVITFLLVLTFFSTAIDRRASKTFAGLCIGSAMLLGVMVGGAVTGGSMNPARTFGPAIAAGFFQNHFVYWIGPILGGIAAAIFYERILAGDEVEVPAEAAVKRGRRPS